VNINIYQNNLLFNYNFYKKLTKLSIAPVLKSNAYGHGLISIAQLFDNFLLPFFVVDNYFEALILKNAKIKNKILITGYTDVKNILQNKLKNTIYSVGNIDQLNYLINHCHTKTYIDIKVDTGMNRQGLILSDYFKVLARIKENKYIILHGVFSHLADIKNNLLLQKQIKNWNLIQKYTNKLYSNVLFHLGSTSSAGIVNSFKSDVLRLGLGLYGYDTNVTNSLDIKPALEMISILTNIKVVSNGDLVGYNSTFKANQRMVLGIVPVGYYEGVDLRLSNNGYFYYQQIPCKIIGRVSMNITTFDITKVNKPKIGEKIEIISKNANKKNSIMNICKQINTIPYEILVKIPINLKRNFI
jgi:alanine racemase